MLGDAIDDNKSVKKDQAKKEKHVQEDKFSKWNVKVFLEVVFEKVREKQILLQPLFLNFSDLLWKILYIA